MGWNDAIVTWLSSRWQRRILLGQEGQGPNRVGGLYMGKRRRGLDKKARANASRRITRHDVGSDGFQVRRFAIFGTPARCLAAIGHQRRWEGRVTRATRRSPKRRSYGMNS